MAGRTHKIIKHKQEWQGPIFGIHEVYSTKKNNATIYGITKIPEIYAESLEDLEWVLKTMLTAVTQRKLLSEKKYKELYTESLHTALNRVIEAMAEPEKKKPKQKKPKTEE